MGRTRRWAVLGVVAAMVGAGLAGCTHHTTTTVLSRAVVAVDYPFGSLNAATAAGRTPGSIFVRGLTHVGFMSLDAAGNAVANTSFGTVTKVSDSPLTVRYTIADGASWSDGVPVTGADLLLEWAARSGEFDEVVPTLGADGSVLKPETLEGHVAFAATSPALVHATATPTFDAHSLTLVYSRPVADWQVALDVNLPAHIVGRLALGSPVATPSPAPRPTVVLPSTQTPTLAPSTQPTPSPSPTTDWAAPVAQAITRVDHAQLVAISQVWREGATAAAISDNADVWGVTDGPYRVASVTTDSHVVLERSSAYHLAGAARLDTVEVRSDLGPLEQVDALKGGQVDLVAPVDTADVRKALAAVGTATVASGQDSVLQLQVGEKNGGPFDPATYPSDGTARAAATRAAFLAAVPVDAMVAKAGVVASGTVLASAGATFGAATSPSGSPSAAAPVPSAAAGTTSPSAAAGAGTVRILVDTGDPARAAMLEVLVAAEAAAGFTVTPIKGDLATALWSQPERWDVALVPVVQDELPVASVVSRWRTGGATNTTAHADPALDALLDQASAQTDPAAAAATLATVAARLDGDVVLPIARRSVLVATRAGGAASSSVYPIAWGSADLSSWWSWARQ